MSIIIGNQYEVLSRDELERLYKDNWNCDMMDWCGRIITITRNEPQLGNSLHRCKENQWWWSCKWVKPAKVISKVVINKN